MEPLVYDVSTSGHRARDASVVAKVVGGRTYFDAPRHSLSRLVRHRGPVVWQTADYQLRWFTLVAFLRSLRGRKTIAVCYRNNHQAGARFLPRVVRTFLFCAWNALPYCTALTTCPAAPDHRSPEFLYDIEWWDMKAAPLPVVPLPPFAKTGKRLMFLGDPSHLKGIEFFIDCAATATARRIDWHFVLVGPIDALTPERKAKLIDADVSLISGPKDDAAFVSYARQADVVWCCYDPIYDQSSGVFGRALQLNKATIVRANSLLHACQRRYGQGIAVPYGDTNGLLDRLDSFPGGRDRAEDVLHMYDQAAAKLRNLCN